MEEQSKVISLNHILYQRNQQKQSMESEEGISHKDTYKDTLERVQQLITTNHSSELAETLNRPDAKNRLINLIVKYLNSEKLIDRGRDITELANRIYEDMAGLAFVRKYLSDPDVEEININGETGAWVQYKDKKVLISDRFNSPEECASIIKKMAHMGRIILDGTKPFGDSYISKGVRMSGAIAPCVDEERGAICSIRKQKKASITRESLVESGTVTGEMLDFIILCVNNGISVGFAGATGSGKTANMGYVLSQVTDEIRVITIEDTKELALARYKDGMQTNDIVQLYTKDESITLLDLLKLSLRLHPKILVPAEMRGAEALTVQEAGRTGHTIVSSLHANNTLSAYDRILTMCQEAGTPLSEERLLKNIVDAFPIMVFARQLKDNTRKWIEIYEAEGVMNGEIIGKSLYKFVPEKTIRDSKGRILKIEGAHQKLGSISEQLMEMLRINGVEEEIIKKYQ